MSDGYRRARREFINSRINAKYRAQISFSLYIRDQTYYSRFMVISCGEGDEEIDEKRRTRVLWLEVLS